ncbi:hypothetical protein Ddye_002513 [Dipteronia dyeriana]|uniref:Uncharacterized protein n=1 Tax=Dipteronia dyeriana TaxID=168575 RepID=A0AAE0CUJ2_9ROSI|nr:hypothetical protein Ddye_002513 [Dipteronia dyeriana]
MLGSGGSVNFGMPGMLGKLGIGRDGWVVGNVGSVGCGRFGIEGIGGSFGSCRRLRAARLTSMLEIDNTTTKAKNKLLEEAMIRCLTQSLRCYKNVVLVSREEMQWRLWRLYEVFI